MRRGTTPTYEITLTDVSMATVDDICLAFKQTYSGVELTMHLSDGDLTLTADGAMCTLTQEQTNKFVAGKDVMRQVKVKFTDGTVGTSKIETENVYDVLHVEVL